MSDFTLSASILSADFKILGDQISALESGGADWVHIDVMDGHFAPNITMGPFIVEHCHRMTRLPLDVHLMIEKPERHIEAFIKAGANYMSVHLEGNPLIQRTISRIRELGCHPGIAITPSTPSILLETILPEVDFVLIMTVNPGFSGQVFQESAIKKIIQVQKMIDAEGLSAKIQVDGGINAITCQKCIKQAQELSWLQQPFLVIPRVLHQEFRKFVQR